MSAGDVRAALKSSNPKARSSDLNMMAEILSFVSGVIAELPKAEQSELAREKDEVRRILIEAVHSGRPETRVPLKPTGRVERRRGAGLGGIIPLEEGKARLDRYASARPLESWAGPVAGAGEVEDNLGIPRSTLSSWQQKGMVVGLLRGTRKLAYPLDQFVDARPLEGIADILRLAPEARSAWLWLRQPHGALNNRAPLDALKAGDRQEVVIVAERDFA
ncbi:antitoxin Xre/MbcA/ParS toxin-binding domain-containing protein [Novosphingobium mathurense]|uniref:antitoxin Xre/MbcA/ParS-like domain-containing protein n=1 Tax=Novosphingobium mathurense TaxID=428990 RepID=UPI0009A7A830|nr:antitoxin Xre/MbcA/ParS toxin-binding domain-containing protein [Novosphingobium mathurense]